MKGLQLIYDLDAAPEFVVEEEINEATGTTSKKYKIKGIFSTIGEKNRNGRIYPRQLWENEVSKYQMNFTSGSINTLMEWEHPARTSVDPMEAVAKITDLKIKGKYVMGEAVLLDNPKANQIKSLIDNGVKISVSSRGVGSVKNGIVENFKLVTYDIVASPSDYNASMNGLVESYQLNEGIIEDLTFGLDYNGNIVPLSESDPQSFGQVYEQSDINTAFVEKFSKLLDELKAK
ncbi:putative prohead core protein precursor [Vibrio phage phiKT1024]|nr:putative prohead core protein precursor [Vibrio phage phiKT1024]